MSKEQKAAEVLKRAYELQPVLKERVSIGDNLRRIPDETIRDFHDAGFFKLLQPALFGGFEASPQALFDVQIAIAEACASSAWVLGVTAVHNWQLALFPRDAQVDVWGANPNTLIASSYAPTGTVERVEDGYRLRGRWSFSSGCDHCEWVFLGGFAPPEKDGTPPDMRTFLVPKRDYVVDDNWHVSGLRATGSKDIVVGDAFVPEYRTHRLIHGFFRNSPGNEINGSPLYRLPFGQIFVRSVSTSAIGIAQSALNIFRELAAARVAAGDGSKVAEDAAVQTVCARASMLVDEVKLVLHRNMAELMACASAGSELSTETRVRFRHDSSMAVVKCVEAVDLLFTASGGRAIFLSHPLQRCFQDIHAARAHFANNPDKPSRNLGGVLLGAKTGDYFI